MSGVSILYGDVAPEAKENFVPTTSETEFNTVEQLQKYNLNFPNYENPCELYSVLLDGNAKVLPSAPDNANLGWWGEQLSRDEGRFFKSIVLTLESEGNYTSSGFSFTFDPNNGMYATHINIHWYRVVDGETTDLGEKDFYPNAASYFCVNKVEMFNKVVITFSSINMPYTRFKLRSIDYGQGTWFGGRELKSVKLIQEINPISSEISINTADFTLDIDGEQYSFQSRQPLSIYFDGKLKSTTFIKKYTRKSRKTWQIQSEDYIGAMEDTAYFGGIYSEKNAVDLITDIFTVAKVPFQISEGFEDVVVSGYIPYTNCRNALMQVAFAIQAVVDTSNSDVVKVYSLQNDIKQTIPLNRIMQGQNFTDEDTVSAVELHAHTYKPVNEELEVYSAEESGIGDKIFVTFAEPLHNLNIINGEIIESGNNYAEIKAYEGCVLKGQKYEHGTFVKTRKNPLILANDLEKIIAITEATLVSPNNVDNILEKCYNWLTRVNQVNLKIVEGKHVTEQDIPRYGEQKYGAFIYGTPLSKEIIYDQEVNVGEKIKVNTEYLGEIVGTLIKQTFGLGGGIIVKDAVVK
jgi:hypothetical protein